jgi:hypothetical protein
MGPGGMCTKNGIVTHYNDIFVLENIALYILERVSATIIEENMLKELIL